jgi:subtilisin family serine protease
MSGSPKVKPEPPDAEIVVPSAPPALSGGGAPGQVVLRLRADDPGAARTLANAPVYGAPVAPDRTGWPELDRLLDRAGTRAVYRVSDGAPRLSSWDNRLAEPEPDPLGTLVVVDVAAGNDPASVAAELSEVDGVEEAGPVGTFTIAAEPAGPVIPGDPGFLAQWGLLHVRAPAAWAVSTGDSAVAVAVVDTGCDLDHPDLAGQLGRGWNALEPGRPPRDDHGHGTHVAGIIAASGDNGRDVAGVTWDCTVLPVKVLDATGHAVGISVARGIAWAARHAQVINCSIQGPVDDLATRTALEYARGRGVVVVTAMGNTGSDESTPSFPAAYARDIDTVLAVGAVDRAHRRSVWSPTASSNTGSWIGLAAPGTNVLSLRLGGGAVLNSGTSMACPHVAGAAALLRTVAPRLTAREVVRLLTGTAGALRDLPTDPVPNPSYGAGLLDVRAALDAVPDRVFVHNGAQPIGAMT